MKDEPLRYRTKRRLMAYGLRCGLPYDLLLWLNRCIDTLAHPLDTRLGENGSRLLGGQKQRLDLARALLQKAPILILDEPVSHLDPGSEAAVAESLQRIHNETDITVILVSHEPETVRDADQIAVIEAGCITAVGEHETLMRSSLWYRNTFINAADSAVA